VRFFPLFLRLEGRRVVVVGAGPACEPKIAQLVEAGAAVHVIAPSATERVRELVASGAATWDARPFAAGDLAGAWLVVSATGDPEVQRAIADEAAARRTFVVAIDDLEHGSAATGSVLRRPPFVVAISSSAEAPALTRLLREILERALPEERWVARARELRRAWKRDKTPHASRFRELVRAIAGDDD